MSLVSNVDNILFASSFAVDKIHDELFSGSFSVGASSFAPFSGNVVTSTLVHTFGVNVLPVMLFSIDGTNWYDGGTMIYNAGASVDTRFSASCYTTSTTLVIVAQNFTSGALTCHYKVVLLAES